MSPACNPLLLGNEFLEFFMRRACYVMTSCSFHEMSGDVCELLWNYDRYHYASTSVNTTSTLFMQIKRKKTNKAHTHTHSFPPPSFSLSLSRTSWHCFIILACTSCLHWVKLTVPWLPLLSPHTNVNTDHHEAGEEGKNRRVGGKEGSRGRLERDTNRKICSSICLQICLYDGIRVIF